MRNPKKITGTIFKRSIQKTEYGLAQVTLEGQKKMIPFLLTGLGRDVVEGAKFKGVLISQNCKGFPSNVIANVDITKKPSTTRGLKTQGVKITSRSLNGNGKGSIDEIDNEGIVIAQDLTGTRYVSYQPGHWYVSEKVNFTPTRDIDPITGLLMAINVTPE